MFVMFFDTESCDSKTPMIIQISWCVFDMIEDPVRNLVEHDHLIKDLCESKQWSYFGHNIRKSTCLTSGENF